MAPIPVRDRFAWPLLVGRTQGSDSAGLAFHGAVGDNREADGMSKGVRRRRALNTTAALGFAALAVACANDVDAPGDVVAATRPKLLVLVVVDQLSSDLLEEQADVLGGGLATMMREGAYLPRVDVGYALTNSAPGHATAATGVLPNRHGMVDNGWMEQDDDDIWYYVSAVSDPDQSVVGGLASSDGVSPHRRLSPSLGDWALSRDLQSRAVSIGQGPISANSMAAASGGSAFWFSADANGFVTSTYYLDALPDWVMVFNQDVLPNLQRDSVWTPVSGASEGPVHSFAGADVDAPSFAAWYQQVPFLDEAILRLASEAVSRLQLGRRGAVDVLTINLSSLDEAGHRYGSSSIEKVDALVRIDRAVGDFMAFLDDRVGAGGWALALTGDHGVAPSPDAPLEAIPGAQRVSLDDLRDLFEALEDTLAHVPEAQRRRVAHDLLSGLAFVHRIYTIEELAAVDPTEPGFLGDYARSFLPGRILDWPVRDLRGDLSPASLGLAAIQMTDGSVVDFAVGVHGSPYPYDRQVPLLFWAAGTLTHEIESHTGSVGLVDLAPTLAGMAGLTSPSAVDGRDLAANRGR